MPPKSLTTRIVWAVTFESTNRYDAIWKSLRQVATPPSRHSRALSPSTRRRAFKAALGSSRARARQGSNEQLRADLEVGGKFADVSEGEVAFPAQDHRAEVPAPAEDA